MFRYERRPQTYANHVKIVPAYHVVAFGILLVNLGWRGWVLVREPSIGGGVDLALAVALILVFLAVRIFALSVQDRVIRLEERMRLERLLPADQRARIDEIGVRQLVALRFACDSELPALARAVLDGELSDPREIKRRVKTWRADYQRC